MKFKPKWLVVYNCYDSFDRSWPVAIVGANSAREAIEKAMSRNERWTWEHGNTFRVVKLENTQKYRMATSLIEVTE